MKFLGHTISYAIFIVLIIVSSFLFAEEFKKNLKRLTVSGYQHISLALNDSLSNSANKTDCILYPVTDFYFRANAPTWIDITISVFVVGK
jgi:hypothetical protein